MYASDLRHNNPALEEKLRQLYALKTGSKVDLSFRPPYLKLLEDFGNPHQSLPPTIHVAGTNGKGSTIAFMRAILESAGYKAHAYTSPHLLKFNERIVLAGREITDKELEPLIDEALTLNQGREITFFEITTAIAFKAFAENPADILLLETGLGGRLDCTNVIENPLITIITAIGMDHTEFLGESIEKIAAEKAGILKPGAPCILARQPHEQAAQIITTIAKEKNVPLLHVQAQSINKISLIGAHQIQNAQTACTALQSIKDQFPIPETAFKGGLKSARWPARLQNISAAIKAPPHAEIWLDGGHNEDAARTIAAQAKIWNANDARPLHIILGMMKTKNREAYTRIIRPHCASIQNVPIPGEPGSHAAGQSYEQTLESLLKDPVPKRILITGSLYLAGHVLKSCS